MLSARDAGFRAFARSVVLGVHQYAEGTGCTHLEGGCLFPKGRLFTAVLGKRPALGQNGRLETHRTATACMGAPLPSHSPKCLRIHSFKEALVFFSLDLPLYKRREHKNKECFKL